MLPAVATPIHSVFIITDVREWRPTESEWHDALGQIHDDEAKRRITRFHKGFASPAVCRHWEMEDPKTFVIARLLLQGAFAAGLSRYGLNDASAVSAVMGVTAEGRPHVGATCTWLNANVSHAGGCVCLATLDIPGAVVGCDIMPVELSPPQDMNRSNVDDFFADFATYFTAAEWAWIRTAVPAPHSAPFMEVKRFMTLWSLKESLIKAIGIGLGFELQHASFTLTRSDVWADDFYTSATQATVTLVDETARARGAQWRFLLLEKRDSNVVAAMAIAPVGEADGSSFGATFPDWTARDVLPPAVDAQLRYVRGCVNATDVLS